MQRTFEFVVTSLPEPQHPLDLWAQLDEEQSSAVVAVLARLMVQALKREEETDER